MPSNYKLLLVFFCYVLSALAAVSWGIYLFARRKRSPQNFYLGIMFALVGLLYLRNSFLGLPVIDDCNIYNPLSYFVLIFVAPFFMHYVYFALNERHSLKSRQAHFLPFVLLGSIGIILGISNTPHIPFCHTFSELLSYRNAYPLYVGFFLLMVATFLGQIIVYCIMALIKFVRVAKQYKTRGLSLRPVNMLIVEGFLFLAYAIACVIFMSNKNCLSMEGAGFHLFVATVVTVISILNLRLKLPIQTFPEAVKMPGGEKNDCFCCCCCCCKKNTKENDAEMSLVTKIVVAFEEEEIFKRPNLHLQKLASEVGSNRTYVSDCINNHFGCNFNQLLSRHRINAAKKLLLNTDMPLQKIIDDVGFNTRSSFYKAFKENVSADMPPTEWRKKHASEDETV